MQAEALGYLAEAYLLKRIGHNDFVGVATEIKRINPVIFGGDERSRIFHEEGGIVSGPYGMLPSAFISDQSIVGGNIMINPGSRYLTNLGQCFYRYVYERMTRDDIKKQ